MRRRSAGISHFSHFGHLVSFTSQSSHVTRGVVTRLLSRAARLLRLKAPDKLTGVAASLQSDKLQPSGDEIDARARIKDLLFFV
jgi:hypothetical protein